MSELEQYRVKKGNIIVKKIIFVTKTITFAKIFIEINEK